MKPIYQPYIKLPNLMETYRETEFLSFFEISIRPNWIEPILNYEFKRLIRLYQSYVDENDEIETNYVLELERKKKQKDKKNKSFFNVLMWLKLMEYLKIWITCCFLLEKISKFSRYREIFLSFQHYAFMPNRIQNFERSLNWFDFND